MKKLVFLLMLFCIQYALVGQTNSADTLLISFIRSETRLESKTIVITVVPITNSINILYSIRNSVKEKEFNNDSNTIKLIRRLKTLKPSDAEVEQAMEKYIKLIDKYSIYTKDSLQIEEKEILKSII